MAYRLLQTWTTICVFHVLKARQSQALFFLEFFKQHKVLLEVVHRQPGW
jgi:hypothetical protein